MQKPTRFCTEVGFFLAISRNARGSDVSDDLHIERTDTRDAALQEIALLHGTDTSRRSGEDNITRLQFPELRRDG